MIEQKEEGCRQHTQKTDSPLNNYETKLNYQKQEADSSKKSKNSAKRQEKVAERRAQIPRAYRATYSKAVNGKSLRAAINAQCLECVCWQRKEITLCTDLACPLYAVRPYQRILQNGHGGGFSSAESTDSDS